MIDHPISAAIVSICLLIEIGYFIKCLIDEEDAKPIQRAAWISVWILLLYSCF